MTDDALERLKRRQRPEVASRDVALTSPQTPPTPASPDPEESSSKANSTNLDLQIPRLLDTQNPGNIENTKPVEELKTKQSTLRLEIGVCDRLQNACRKNDLSREVLIEAMFEYCESNPQAWEAVMAEAKQRAEYRQQVANIRRAQSMMQRFGEQA